MNGYSPSIVVYCQVDVVKIAKGELKIAHKFSGLKVADILKQKKGGIKQARLSKDSPSWDEFSRMAWEQIEGGARANRLGFKIVRKLSDKRFDR